MPYCKGSIGYEVNVRVSMLSSVAFSISLNIARMNWGKRDESKRDESKRDESKRDESKRDESKRDETVWSWRWADAGAMRLSHPG